MCILIPLLQPMYNLYITHRWNFSYQLKIQIHSNQYHLNADLHNHIMIRPINQLEQHIFFQFRLTLWCAWVWWWWSCCLFGRSYLLEKLKAFDLSSVSCDDDDDESSQKQSLWVSKGQFVSRDTLHVSKLEFDCQTCWRKKACPLLVCGCC